MKRLSMYLSETRSYVTIETTHATRETSAADVATMIDNMTEADREALGLLAGGISSYIKHPGDDTRKALTTNSTDL